MVPAVRSPSRATLAMHELLGLARVHSVVERGFGTYGRLRRCRAVCWKIRSGIEPGRSCFTPATEARDGDDETKYDKRDRSGAAATRIPRSNSSQSGTASARTRRSSRNTALPREAQGCYEETEKGGSQFW